MTDTTDHMTLDRLGDAIAGATERDLRQRRGHAVRRIAVAVAALAIVGTGTAAAAGLLSPRQVEAAMPAGAVLFDQTDPTCTLDASGSAFHCTLASAPTAGDDDYTDTKEILVVGGVVAGGCLGLDVAGLSWDCFIGQDAVDHQIITQDFLGEPAGPGRG